MEIKNRNKTKLNFSPGPMYPPGPWSFVKPEFCQNKPKKVKRNSNLPELCNGRYLELALPFVQSSAGSTIAEVRAIVQWQGSHLILQGVKTTPPHTCHTHTYGPEVMGNNGIPLASPTLRNTLRMPEV